jgi:hypothetical protein
VSKTRGQTFRGLTPFCWTVVLAGCAALSACRGPESPSDPPPPPVTNAPPVIASIKVQGTGPREPEQYATLDETVNVSAVVTDAETPVTQLTYEWTSSVGGSFNGTGANVTWTAPRTATTPANATLTLTVIERYGASGINRVVSTSIVSLHDSVKEVSDFAVKFLKDFSDQKPPDEVMQNFTATCPGRADEYSDVLIHQQQVTVVTYNIDTPSTTVRFTGSCPHRNRQGDACAQVPVRWVSKQKSTGKILISEGIDQVTAILENNQWRLCASDFIGTTTDGLRITNGLWFDD